MLDDHHLVAERLTTLRDRATGAGAFRRALSDLALFLLYEVLADVAVAPTRVETPLAPADGWQLSEQPVLVPVLRAGLGMLDSATRLLPEAPVAFLGYSRDEETMRPRPYMSALPEQVRGRTAVVLDPMLATGGTAYRACESLLDSGVSRLLVTAVVGAEAGVERLMAASFPGRLVVAAVDPHLDDSAFIVPGLGDAGDRQFGAWQSGHRPGVDGTL